MSIPSPIILVLGAGPNIGQSVARAFAAKGYRTALVSRKATEANNTANEIHIQADFTDPSSVVNVFSKVKSLLGMPPSVVVYNGTSSYLPKALSLSLENTTIHASRRVLCLIY